MFDSVTTIGLLLTLVMIFSFQGNTILEKPLHIVLIAVPLILQTFLIFAIAYIACRVLKLPYKIAAPAGMICASNFFELAVAVAIPCGTGNDCGCADRSSRDAVPCKKTQIKRKTGSNMSKKKVAFICVHNSCRSQIAEALGKHLASDVFESYSAGTETKPQINQDAVRIMKELYGIDMEKTQYSKLISDIPAPDIAISMGCNVGCPFIGRAFDDNWGLEDPTGSEDQVFVEIIREIGKRILQLKQSLI